MLIIKYLFFLNYDFFFLIDGKTLINKALFIFLLFLVLKFKVAMKFRIVKGNVVGKTQTILNHFIASNVIGNRL